jgi:hypothetical protein
VADASWTEAVDRWVSTFDEIAPGTIEGVYVVGSAALGDWQARSSDIDIVAVTAEPADEEMAGTLLTAHAVFVERSPQRRVDGPFVAWGDLTVPPHAITRPWMLDGRFHHDAECFELNPVTWFTLARYGVRVRGPQPSDLPIALELDERVRFVVDNAKSYWAGVHAELAGALGELGPEDTLPSSVAEWCLLGACRMLYTAATGDVTSKSGAGRWAATVLNEENRRICQAVVEMRNDPAESAVRRDVLVATEAAMREVLRRIGAVSP